jgi:hypothetical protein
VYWDPNKTSPINGKAGAYADINGGARYLPSQWPRADLSLPPGV